MKACIFCLRVTQNVCLLGDSGEKDFIQEIFASNGFPHITKLSYICLMCRYLLTKSYNFIQRTLTAQKALQAIIDSGIKVTVSTLSEIDRLKLNLDVNLVYHATKVNYHFWDENDSTIQNPLEYYNEADDSVIKTEIDNTDSETPLDPELQQCPFPNDSDDGDDNINYEYECTENSIDNIKEEIDCDEKKSADGIELDLREGMVTRSKRVICYNDKSSDYSDGSDSDDDEEISKCKAKKAKTINCKRKEKTLDDLELPPDYVEKKYKRRGKGRKRKRPVDTRKYPMKCDHCDYIFQNKTEHCHHYLIYHPGIQYPYARKAEFVCQHCGIAKTSRVVLNDHESTHGEKTIQCPKCAKMFHNHTQLKRHTLRHGAARLFCDFCGKGFVSRPDLVLHIRIHTGVKPFKCVLCGMGFAHRGNVTIHMRTRHKQDATVTPKAAVAVDEPHTNFTSKTKTKPAAKIISNTNVVAKDNPDNVENADITNTIAKRNTKKIKTNNKTKTKATQDTKNTNTETTNTDVKKCSKNSSNDDDNPEAVEKTDITNNTIVNRNTRKNSTKKKTNTKATRNTKNTKTNTDINDKNDVTSKTFTDADGNTNITKTITSKTSSNNDNIHITANAEANDNPKAVDNADITNNTIGTLNPKNNTTKNETNTITTRNVKNTTKKAKATRNTKNTKTNTDITDNNDETSKTSTNADDSTNIAANTDVNSKTNIDISANTDFTSKSSANDGDTTKITANGTDEDISNITNNSDISAQAEDVTEKKKVGEDAVKPKQTILENLFSKKFQCPLRR